MQNVRYPIVFLIVFFLSSTIHASGGGGGSSPYYSIKPPFVVNVNDGDRVRHMQITTQLHATDVSNVSHLELHKPAIQHALVTLFSGRDMDAVKTVAGKQKLREEALKIVQKVMKENAGIPVVDAVYFTDFIIQ